MAFRAKKYSIKTFHNAVQNAIFQDHYFSDFNMSF